MTPPMKPGDLVTPDMHQATVFLHPTLSPPRDGDDFDDRKKIGFLPGSTGIVIKVVDFQNATRARVVTPAGIGWVNCILIKVVSRE